MQKFWNDSYDINEVLRAIEYNRKTFKKGFVEFKDAYMFEEHVAILLSIINFSKKLPEADKYKILRESLFKAAEIKNITSQNLRTEIKNRENNYFKNVVFRRRRKHIPVFLREKSVVKN